MASTVSAPKSTVRSSPSASPRNFVARLSDPVSVVPLVQFRVALGLILLWEAYRYLSSDWPRVLFLEQDLLFHYYGFEWIRPLPETLHIGLFYALAGLAVAATLGFCYRLSTALLFFGWAYVFLLDQALYLNHLYLVTLIIGLSVLLPANQALSFDALLRPKLRSDVVPRWPLTLLRAQIGLVYFYGGVAKLNPDWLSGVPMQSMLLERAELLGQAAGEPWVALFFAYSGLLLDLFIVPLLWWPRTRLIGLLLIAGFHLTNHVLFRIGIFPWFMLAATLILWPPYPLSMLSFARIYGVLVGIGMVLSIVADRPVPYWAWGVGLVAGAALLFPPEELLRFNLKPNPDDDDPPADPIPSRARPLVLSLLGIYLGWQFLMPLRHFVYPGDVSWHEQGHKWAWHMKLRIKNAAVSPVPQFLVLDEANRLLEIVDPLKKQEPFTGEQQRRLITQPEEKVVREAARTVEQGYDTPVSVMAQPHSPMFSVFDGDERLVGLYQVVPLDAEQLHIVPMIDPVGIGSPLSPRQVRTMTTRPDLILQFAHFLRDKYRNQVEDPIKVTAQIAVSLNSRPPQDLVDPEANLAEIEPRLWPPATWILPLETPPQELQRVDIARLLKQRKAFQMGVEPDEL